MFQYEIGTFQYAYWNMRAVRNVQMCISSSTYLLAHYVQRERSNSSFAGLKRSNLILKHVCRF